MKNPTPPPAALVAPQAASAGQAAVDPAPRLARIARRAHELFEARGATQGQLDDWLQAEREIDSSQS